MLLCAVCDRIFQVSLCGDVLFIQNFVLLLIKVLENAVRHDQVVDDALQGRKQGKNPEKL